MADLRPGLSATVEREVTEAMTAEALGSGDVPVLGTPAVLTLAEEAAVAALAGRLDEGSTTVGSWVELHHLAPTPVGARVSATATLVAVEGRRLTFDVTVADPAGAVAEVRHTRAMVPREPFLATARSRGTD
jgi:predicted thioesterase